MKKEAGEGKRRWTYFPRGALEEDVREGDVRYRSTRNDKTS